MKKVVLSPEVELVLQTLSADELRRVQAWFTHLANWDGDTFIRANSHSLPEIPGVFVLRTSTDLRIFFRLEGETITVLDVAKKQAIVRTAQ